MPLQMRNPFRKPPGDQASDLSGPTPTSPSGPAASSAKSGATTSVKPLDIRPNGHQQPSEYKLSEINDSGVFLPPSPTERPNFWSTRSHTSTNSSRSHRSVFKEEEPFNMSRESFDSYRRSFDICARSPMPSYEPEQRPRHSLDARHLRHPYPRSSASASASASSSSSPPTQPELQPPTFQRPCAVPPLPDRHFNQPEQEPEDRFEDVGLDGDKDSSTPVSSKPTAKRSSIFARFGGGHGSDAAQGPNGASGAGSRPSSSGHFFARKRGTSGQGAELGSMTGERRSAADGARGEPS